MFKWWWQYFLISLLVSDFRKSVWSVPSISVAVLELCIIFLKLKVNWIKTWHAFVFLKSWLVSNLSNISRGWQIIILFFFLSYFQMLAAWVHGWIEDDLLISSIFALDVCGIRSPNAVWKVDGKIVFSLKIINFSNNFHLRWTWSWKLTDKFLIG